MTKFQDGERVVYYGQYGVVKSVETKVSYTVLFDNGTKRTVYESDLTSVETTESDWEGDGGA